jgi:hypothetical protein
MLNDSVLDVWAPVHQALVKLRGGDKNYAPLFPGFPDSLPDFDVAWFRFGFATLRLLESASVGAPLSSLWWENISDDDVRSAMDFSDWGWWPASSVPLDPDQAALAEAAQIMLPVDTKTEWVTLRVLEENDVTQEVHRFGLDCAYSASSLNAGVIEDLTALITDGTLDDVDLAVVRFREIRSLFYAQLFSRALSGDITARATLVSPAVSPDDVLRLLAGLADSDVSLATKIKFAPLKRPARRLVMEMLESSAFLPDIWRRPGLWRALAKSLHVGEHATKYPKAFAAFDNLRSIRRTPDSPSSRYEAALALGNFAGAIAAVNAPGTRGTLLRQLRRLASLAVSPADQDLLVAALTLAADDVSVTRLLDLRAVLADNGQSYPRIAVGKSGSLMKIDQAPGHLAISDQFLARLLGVIDGVVAIACDAKGRWDSERVWIDEDLEKVLIPSQLRSTSDARISVERGSRLKVPAGSVLRLFVHWQEPCGDRSDLDLSCVALNDDFSYRSHVSWTNLRDGRIVHSGDITSAPAPTGASEFIDIDLDHYNPASSGRYLVPCIYRFSGPNFSDLDEAFAGWMIRDVASRSRKAFDPATVQSAFDLVGSAPMSMPFVYDALNREIIYLDGFAGREDSWGSRVESTDGYVSSLARTCASRHLVRANLGELAHAHARSRGALVVSDREDATITFGMDDACTYNVLRPEQVLAELA